MVLGFALCTTFAFAQTKVVSRDFTNIRAEKPNLSEMTKAPVDYKASIFTKDGIFTEERRFQFTAQDMAEITYGAIASTDHMFIDGHDSAFTTDYQSVPINTNAWCQWRHYSDTNNFKANFATDYPTRIARFFCGNSQTGQVTEFTWLLKYVDTMNNGFMFFGFDHLSTSPSVGRVNSYFTLPAVTRTLPAGTSKMVNVSFSQFYYSFYDQCFIDYKIGNTWYTREVNVNGIDVDVNGAVAASRYVMPANLATESTIQMRVRISALKYAVYGYGWFLDDFTILTDNRTHSWEFNHSSAFDGFYGTIPQGMNIPLTYGVQVRNTNLNALANATINISNAPENGTWTPVASSTPYSIATGDVEKNYRLYIDERGFLANTSHDDQYEYTYGAYAYLDDQPTYGITGNYPAPYQGRGLNTQTPGANFYAVTVTCDSASSTKTAKLDTVLYTVSSKLQFDPNDPNYDGRVNGYRWGRDNGLIPSNSSFQVGYTDDHYLDADDDANHALSQRYQVMVRFVTGNVIPEGFVFKGVEYVPATNLDTAMMRGARIYPIIMETDGGVEWEDVPCGIDNMTFSVSHSDVSNLPSTYVLPSNQPNYSALNVKFLDEPEIKPNTAYYFGYVLSQSATFKLAGQQASYRDGDVNRRYTANPDTKPYARQNTPVTPLDVLVYDYAGYVPTDDGSENHWIMGWNIDNYPMIRPIVGEADERVPVNVIALCNDNQTNAQGVDTLGIAVEHNGVDICGDQEEVNAGSVQSFIIRPVGDHTVINEVYFNGEVIDLYDENAEEDPDQFAYLFAGEYNVEDEQGRERLSRNYYELRLYGVPEREGGHVITATFDWVAWNHVGIDPVAPEVSFSLAPNPATSTVKLNVSGVDGMLNCSILDMSGRVVYNRDINAEAETSINVSNIPAGAYFVRITNDTFSKIEKLIIK